FRYSPERVEEIKSLPGARFDRAAKSWRLPPRSYHALLSSAHFHPEAVCYTFSGDVLEQLAGGDAGAQEEAARRFAANPFEVSESDISLLDLDVVFRMHAASRSLRAVPHFRSKARGVIERIPGAHYVKSDKGYYVPTHHLSGTLKTLRDK